MKIVIAMVLSATFLLAGCGTDTTGEVPIEPIAAREEIPNTAGLMEENDIKEENHDKDMANENDATDNQEASSGKTDIYNYI